jgi:TonB family protein
MIACSSLRLPLLSGVLLGALSLPLAEGAAQRPKPPLSAFVDSAALVQAVAALELPPLPRGVRPLFNIDFDSTGALAEVKPMLPGVPAAYAGPVVEAIRAHALPQEPGRGRDTYLRVVAGPQPLVDRPELREELPRLRNRAAFLQQVRRSSSRYASAYPVLRAAGMRGEVKFRVLSDGRADLETVQVVRSTGSNHLDEELVAAVLVMRFAPARIEGVPVAVWVTQPVHFRVSESPLPREPRFP